MPSRAHSAPRFRLEPGKRATPFRWRIVNPTAYANVSPPLQGQSRPEHLVLTTILLVDIFDICRKPFDNLRRIIRAAVIHNHYPGRADALRKIASGTKFVC